MGEGIGMKMNAKKLTAQCAVLQGSYWVAVCAINGFATVFLLHIGLKSSQIGVVLALGNILGVILQPFVAAAADRAKRVTLQQMTAGDGNCHNPAADSDAVYVKNGTGNRAVIFDYQYVITGGTATNQFYQFVLCESWYLCGFWNWKRCGICILCGGSFVFGNSDRQVLRSGNYGCWMSVFCGDVCYLDFHAGCKGFE